MRLVAVCSTALCALFGCARSQPIAGAPSALATSLPATASAQPQIVGEGDPALLASIHDIGLLVNCFFYDQAIDKGVASILRPHVELKLRMAGLTVHDSNKMPSDMPALFITVTADKVFADESVPNHEMISPFGYDTISVELRDKALVARDQRKQIVNAVLWQEKKGSTLYFAGSSAPRSEKEIEADVDELLDKFLNDYLKANPKP